MRLVKTWSLGLAVLLHLGCHSQGDPGPQGGQQAGSQAMPVEVERLSPGEVREATEYLGALISRSSITVFPQVAGYVKAIPLKPGARVTQGEVLVVVDPRIESASLRATQAQRAAALAQREFAQRTRKRSEQLLKEGLQSRQDYDQAVAQAQQAEASARAVEAQVQAQQVQLGFYEVSAPFAGTVGDFPVKVGDFVTQQTPLTTLDQSNTLEVSVQVPVERAQAVKVGSTPVEVLDAEGRLVVSAPVFFVAPRPNANTQLVEIRGVFENTQGLRAGQFVRARVVYATREALRVPTAAVTRISSQTFVFVARDADGGTVAQRAPVSVGLVSGNDYEVTGGLDAGTPVVLSSIQLLRDGQPIQPKAHVRDAPPGVGGSGQGPDGGPPSRDTGSHDAGSGAAPGQ
ncbi:efflux RND transporter periplasmic adaptor subunit [Comamonas sp. JC664]|uniref:efflux RND transporter periplasmic adaptor subunit n=1 Tax=Comamonas sp. JC664 TaxID=2801917 RepID=UPI00174CB42C|nr:efflux RND transporter periplasmic adaptor subunit [Comamonas sp. JC664]MBL0698617.1 efflux RND transporter periplasmic adaptor subunit [Comamonas sp. JC664]GHG78170.1 multidrug transporter [Comamonas sp. KCTC 72670]